MPNRQLSFGYLAIDKDDSQNKMILDHLKVISKITKKEAIDLYGVMNLGARIMELREAGFNIRTHMTAGKNRWGKPVRYATYFLIENNKP